MVKIKKLIIGSLSLLCCFSLINTSVLAQSNEPVSENTTEDTTMKPLTPDGNLTLVDDDGNHESVGKQFITLVTKSGNYFYLIIDRDDKGNETVHFLNQVDEADLFALMEDKQVQEILDKKENDKIIEPKDTIDELIKEEPKKENNEKLYLNAVFLIGLIIIFLLATAGFFYFQSKNKQKVKVKPDPDSDYEDDFYILDDIEENADTKIE